MMEKVQAVLFGFVVRDRIGPFSIAVVTAAVLIFVVLNRGSKRGSRW